MQKITTFISQRKLEIWAGVIGSLLFVVVFTIEGWLRPGYQPMSMYVSDLSLGQRGWIQITNFIIWGLLFFVFSRGVTKEFQIGKASKAGPLLLAIIAVCFFVSGPLVTDPSTLAFNQMSWHGMLHGIFGALVFSLAPVSCLVFYRRFRDDNQWRIFSWWTLVACIIIVVAVIFMKISQLSPSRLGVFVGLIQRIALITYLTWIFTMAWAILARNKEAK
jgi:hypothetical membrane protein